MGIAGDALQHRPGYRPGAGDFAAPGGVVTGEGTDIGHHEDFSFGPPNRAAAVFVVGGAGGQQV